jgi:Holliday junction DNA helicase RuvA
MIAYLDGILAEKKPFSAVIDVNGIGYLTLVSLSTYEKLPERGQKVRLLTHTHVREDAFVLFGFASPEEKEMFQILLGVSGIGPKSALAILSSISTRDLQQCIIDENLDVLTKISGIGKKTAQRLIVELKEKLQKSEVLTRKSANLLPKGEAMDEALAALLSLGYERSEANEALMRVASVKRKLTAEELVKQALSSNSIARIARH